MRLRSRMVGDEDDQPSVASVSSSSMDESSSTGAVLGSPVTRRSWSTTHDSQESSQNPAPVASSVAHPNTHDPQPFESELQTSREQHHYLTDYEVATHTEFEEYPTSIDSQELYTTSPPQTQTQTHRPEESPAYVQTTSSPSMTYSPPYINTNPQTPNQPQPQHRHHYSGYQTPHSTPYSRTPTQPPRQPTSNPSYLYESPISPAPARSLEYGEPREATSYTNYEQPPYHPPPAYARTTFPPLQSHHHHSHSPQPSHLQTPAPTSTSEPLNRYVTSDNEESWSPAAQTNPETHKRRISEADETVDGFRHNKLRKDLDEIEEGGEASQSQGPRKRRRRRRGGKGRARPRSRSRSRDRGNGKGRDKRDMGGNGRREEMRS